MPRDFIYDMPSSSAPGDLQAILSQSQLQQASDQYLNNSSVAKTAASKRRNISIGLWSNDPPDRGNLETAQNLNGI